MPTNNEVEITGLKRRSTASLISQANDSTLISRNSKLRNGRFHLSDLLN
jgi:hypothetical protein